MPDQIDRIFVRAWIRLITLDMYLAMRVALIACARRVWRPFWAQGFSCAQHFILIVGARDIVILGSN
jgi:hypothetical protein